MRSWRLLFILVGTLFLFWYGWTDLQENVLPKPKPEVQEPAPEPHILPEIEAAPDPDPAEVHLLARLIHAEARGESLEGKLAVGSVVLNRVKDERFPADVAEVIYEQDKQGRYQFCAVASGSINLTPSSRSYEAAQTALQGIDPTDGALFFYNPSRASDPWIRTRPVTAEIGGHAFAR